MRHERLIKSIIGADSFEALKKAIVKEGTSSVVDITELHDALNIAPKSVVAFLINHLQPMKKGESKEISLPWDDNARMIVNKLDNDVYKGQIIKDSKVVDDFDLCSIPQLSAHILSVFELYDESQKDINELIQEDKKPEVSKEEIDALKLQLQNLSAKLDALLVVSAARPFVMPQVQPAQPVEVNVNPVQEGASDAKKPDFKKAEGDLKSKIVKFFKSLKLKKAGVMPKPPKPGRHAGGQGKTTKAGFHGFKTPHSDLNANVLPKKH